MNARRETVTVPTETVIEAIRHARADRTIGIRDNTTGEPGIALFAGTKLRLVLNMAEVQAVKDMLTVAELEALFLTEPGAGQ